MAGLTLSEEDEKWLNESPKPPALELSPEDEAFLSGAPVPPKPMATAGQQALHVLKGLGQGFVDTAEMDYNIPAMAEAGIKLVGGEGLPGFNSQTNRPTLEVGVDAIGGKGAYDRLRETVAGEVVDKEQYPWIDRLRTVAEWAGPGGLVNGLRRKGMNMLVDAAQGVGAAAGEAAEDYITGDQPLTGAGEVVGGVLSGMAGARRFRAKKPQDELAAFAFIKAHADDPESAMNNLRVAVARGDKGTLGDLTGDKRIAAMERASLRADTDFGHELDRVNTELQQQIADRVSGKFGDAPRTPADLAAEQARIDADKLAVSEGEKFKAPTREAAAQARQTANDAAAPTWTPWRTDQTSAKVQSRLDKLDADFKATEVDPRWNAWRDSTDTVDVAPMFDNIDNILEGMNTTERFAFEKKYGSLLNESGLWEFADDAPQILGPNGKPLRAPNTAREGIAVPDDVRGWISRISDAIDNNVRADGSYTPDGRRLIQVKSAAEAAITDPLFREANAASTEWYKRYRSGRTGAARLKGDGGPETYVSRVNLKGDSGAQVIRELQRARDPVLINNVVEHLKAEAKKGNGVDTKFLADYQAVIDALPPEAQTQFTRAAVSEADKLRKVARAEEAAKNIDATTQAELRANQKTPVAEYARNPKGYLKTLLKGDDSAAALKELDGVMRLNGKSANFRGALRDTITDLYLTGGDMAPEVRSKSLKAFRDTMEQLREAKILDPKDIEDMTVQMNRSLSLSERTGQIGVQMAKQTGDFQQLKASILAVMTMKAIPGAGGTESLVLTGAIRRFFKHQLDLGSPKNGAVEALERMLANPEAYIDAAYKYGDEGFKTANSAKKIEMILEDAFKKARDNATTYTRRGQVAAGGDDNGS